jgi:hypothetical protein
MSEFTVYGLEKLEDRVLLAVDVDLNGTTLSITSDGDDDNVVIYGYGTDDIAVYVDEDADGVFDAAYYYTGVKNIKVNMGGGDDLVYAINVDIAGNLDVRLGSGDDEFALSDGYGAYYNEIDGNVTIKGEAGDDNILIAGVDVGKNLTVDAGSGDDQVSVGHYADYNTFYADGFGYYYVTGNVNVDGNAKFTLGDGDDTLNIEPYDYFVVNFSGKLDVDAGKGDDYVEFGTNGDGFGFPYIYVEGKANIKLGDGDDDLQFEYYFYNVDYYATTLFEEKVVLDGGKGNDDVLDGLVDGVVFEDTVQIKNFEIFV